MWHFLIAQGISPPSFWEPDQSFSGLAVTIVGGGPSHAEFRLKLLRGTRFIAVNSACRRVRSIATPDDLLFFLDDCWAQDRLALIKDWPGPAITTSRAAKVRLGNVVRRIDIRDLARGMGAPPEYIGASSGHAAACLAAVMGAARIVLVGFDCAAPGGRTHGHDDYKHRDTGIYAKRFLPAWVALAPAFARLGVEMLNASGAASMIREFPFADLGEALNAIEATS